MKDTIDINNGEKPSLTSILMGKKILWIKANCLLQPINRVLIRRGKREFSKLESLSDLIFQFKTVAVLKEKYKVRDPLPMNPHTE